MGTRNETLTRAGAELKAWRTSQTPKLTQAAAAGLLMVTQGTWAAWERGLKAPDSFNADRIEHVTLGRVKAAVWRYPRCGTLVARAADESGLHTAVDVARAS